MLLFTTDHCHPATTAAGRASTLHKNSAVDLNEFALANPRGALLAGCAPDAIKLFVGSIPKSYTESQLLPFFETVGKVIDLVIVRDKVTRESKVSMWHTHQIQVLWTWMLHAMPPRQGLSQVTMWGSSGLCDRPM